MNKYRLLKMNSRGGRYYAEEIATGLRQTLKTKDLQVVVQFESEICDSHMNSAPQSKHLKPGVEVGSKPANSPNGPKIAATTAAFPTPKTGTLDAVTDVDLHFGHRLGFLLAGECSPQCGHVCARSETSLPQTLHVSKPLRFGTTDAAF